MVSHLHLEGFQAASNLPDRTATQRRPVRRGSSWTLVATLFWLLLAGVSTHAETVTTTVSAGGGPNGVAVNPVTNKIYVANFNSNNVTVINGATNTTTTVSAGSYPYGVAVNPVTNKIYVGEYYGDNVTVIDGTTNSTTTVGTGSYAEFVAVNPVTNKTYVANQSSNNVTVIDGATNKTTTVGTGPAPAALAVNPMTNKIYVPNSLSNTVTVIDGATNKTTTVSAGTGPSAVAVNPVTNKIYVVNQGSNNVTVIDGATNTPATVSAGSYPYGVAVNPVTNKIYVTNYSSNDVTVIDGATNTAVTLEAGTNPFGVAVNSVANQIYVANQGSNNITVIDGATNTTTTVNAGTFPQAVAVNPVTNKIYVANYRDNTVTVIDGATYNTTTVGNSNANEPNDITINPVTNKIYVANNGSDNVTVIDGPTNNTTTVSAGTYVVAVSVNPVTNRIYVANFSSNNVTVIDGATNDTTTVSAGTAPNAVAVNPVTNKIYVANQNSANVTVIDGATNSTTTVSAGTEPWAVAVNPVTNKIYVANAGSANVTVIDGATNSTTMVSAGTSPGAVALDPVTNKIYVANYVSNNVTVIDGATNSTTTVSAGTSPGAVAVNPVTNKIYVANNGSNNVTVIDGATNNTAMVSAGTYPILMAVNQVTNKIYVSNRDSYNVTVIDGATNGTYSTLSAGSPSYGVAVNPVTNRTYIANEGINAYGGIITVITEQQVSPIPLAAGITPLADNITDLLTPTFNFTASNSFTTGPVDNLLYQVDTWQGTWTAGTSQGAGAFSGATSTLQPGFHILYAYATDGEEGTSINTGYQSSPLIGTIAAYGFLVAPPVANVSPGSLDFGSQPVGGTSSAQTLTLSNEGGSTLDFTLGFTGTNASDFAELTTDSCSALAGQLAPSSSCTASIIFTPSTVGSESATLTVTDNSNGIAASTQTVTLTGNGVQSGITISSVNPNSVILVQGGTSQTVTVNLTDTNYTGSVALSTSTLPSGVTATITQPGTGNSGSISLQATSNATLVTNQTITITAGGAGVSSVTSTFSLTVNASSGGGSVLLLVSPTNLNFGIVVTQAITQATALVNPSPTGIQTTCQTQPITITNTGAATLTFPTNAFAISGPNPGDFSRTPPQPCMGTLSDNVCSNGASLVSMQSCVLNVAFIPQAAAARSATLNINTTPSGSGSVTLAGTGMNAFFQFGAATLNPVEPGVPLCFDIVSTSIGLQGAGCPNPPPNDTTSDEGYGTQRYGCALTSVAAVLNTFNSYASTTPASLDAPIPAVNGDPERGLYSLPGTGDMNWPALPQFLEQCNITTTFAGGCNSATVGESLNDYLTQHIVDRINLNKRPDRVILQLCINGLGPCPPSPSDFIQCEKHVASSCPSTHYVVALGPNSNATNDWYLFDPGWNIVQGTNTPNIYTLAGHEQGGFEVEGAVRTFAVYGVKTYSDAGGTGSLELQGLSPVELMVTDASGLSVGSVSPGTDIAGIPGSSYSRDFPLADDTGSSLTLGDPTGIKTAFIPAPSAGPYTVTATGTASGPYTLAIRGVATDGSVQQATVSGTASVGSTSQYQISYIPTPGIPVTATPLPGVTLSVTALTFGSQGIGIASQTQAVTLTNSGVGPLAISGIAIQGDFDQTNSCGTGVAAGANCTINVSFKPTATGPLTGSLTITDNNNGVAGSTQVVSLTGTGTGAVVSSSPSSLTFSAQLSGSTSPAQAVTLTNAGNATLTVSGITASGDFSQTNTCGASVSTGAKCDVSVTFKPTAGGTRTGTLSISDNAPGSPQTVALSGTGQDFTIAAASGSSTTATVAPGSPATYTLNVGGEGGFNQSVSFTCIGAPSEATCTVSPSPVTPGSSATNITVGVTTTAPSVSAQRSRPLPPTPPLSPGLKGLFMLALVLAAMAWIIRRGNQRGVSRWQSTLVPLALGLLLTLALAECGGGGGGGGPTPNPGTPAGTYTLTVTGTEGSGSSALSHSVTLTLNVS
jgi:YVTN family beta-propeller protein